MRLDVCSPYYLLEFTIFSVDHDPNASISCAFTWRPLNCRLNCNNCYWSQYSYRYVNRTQSWNIQQDKVNVLQKHWQIKETIKAWDNASTELIFSHQSSHMRRGKLGNDSNTGSTNETILIAVKVKNCNCKFLANAIIQSNLVQILWEPQGFLWNCFSCFITVRITFTSILYLQWIYMIYMIYIIYTFSQYKSSKKPHSLSANHLITVVLLCQDTQAGLNHTSTQTQHQMEGGLYRQSTFPRSDIFNNWVQYTLWDKGVIRDKPSLTVVLENTAVRSQLQHPC